MVVWTRSITPDHLTSFLADLVDYSYNQDPYSQSYWFSSNHVWMWELNHKEGWALKNWCFWNVVLEKTLESPLDCKEIQPVHPEENQPCIFTGRTGAETEALILCPPDAKSQLTREDLGAGNDWRQEENGTTEDDMVGWHHWLSMDMSLKVQETAKDRYAWHAAAYEVTKSQIWLRDWTAAAAIGTMGV